MYSYSSMTLLYIGIGIIPIELSKLKLWHFHAKLVNLPITLGTVCITHFFWGLNFIFDTRYLYSIKAKVLRVLFQLESPNSNHRNSCYDLDTRDYSMFKTETRLRIWLKHGPTLSEYLGHVE